MQVSRDLVQDAFFVLWEKSETLEIKQSPKAYLYQVVKNSCLNYERHLKVKQSAEAARMKWSVTPNYEDANITIL